jgi:hypothetical protein
VNGSPAFPVLERKDRKERRTVQSYDGERATGPRCGPANEQSAANTNTENAAFVLAPLFPFVCRPATPAAVARESTNRFDTSGFNRTVRILAAY